MFLFQSTHPSWGATSISNSSLSTNSISIHAPIVGCDISIISNHQKIIFEISIHAPIVGCDINMQLLPLHNFQISIHAPIVGCDFHINDLEGLYNLNFNPRTHRGVRRWLHNCSAAKSYFNPRTHRGVRPCNCYTSCMSTNISIHAPIVGCDSFWFFNINISAYFNPRTHRGVRLAVIKSYERIINISIHAPIVGCDDPSKSYIA